MWKMCEMTIKMTKILHACILFSSPSYTSNFKVLLTLPNLCKNFDIELTKMLGIVIINRNIFNRFVII